MTLLNKLSQWQKDQARREGVDGYMVLPFSALKAIAEALPQDESALLAIKGLGPVKVRKYGTDILAMVAGDDAPLARGQKSHRDLLAQRKSFVQETQADAQINLFDESQAVNDILDDKVAAFVASTNGSSLENEEKKEVTVPQNINAETGEVMEDNTANAVGVGDFLAQLNQVLGSYFNPVRVRGEIIGFKRNQNGHAYFEIKDDAGIMRVSVFRNAYDLSGVTLTDGMEVIVTGKPQHHARYGFSFIGEFVELAGEGALKKAYDALKKKLTDDGLLAPERKRALPLLPRRIGLITSPTGAAIGDFTTNVGKYGYSIRFHASTVEGPKAVKELDQAIKRLAQEDLDVLVITRGGGSLESLTAFNNENIVRALADFPVPVIAGIGHEQDETLSTLVADVGVSTPTAAARAVRSSWDEMVAQLDRYEQNIVGRCSDAIRAAHDVCGDSVTVLRAFFVTVIERFSVAQHTLEKNVLQLEHRITHAKEQCRFYDKTFVQYNPLQQLKLGYSITTNAKGVVVRSVKDVHATERLHVRVKDGTIETEVKE